MLLTDKQILANYTADKHLWIGIPSIEVTRGGKTYLTFYSGGVKEEIGNYCMLFRSEDGKSFGEPIAICYADGYRCFDPCLWIDPLGRLWFTWARCPEDGVWAAICDDPDAEDPIFGAEFFIGHNVLMNKPTVLSTGEWLFPLAVWNYDVRTLPACWDSAVEPKGSFACATCDHGKTFQTLGYADVKDRSFDEHMFLELPGGVLRCFVRTRYGIGAADSYDGGLHWGHDFDTGYGGPSSRFFIRRLPSGRVLLINHYEFTGRNNLTAMLSEDDGKTFPYRLLLDERNKVAYPDAAMDAQGRIHITYDRERGAFQKTFAGIMKCAREILTACITEEDILQGKLVSDGSYLKHVAYKLTDYTGPLQNPFHEKERFTDEGYAAYLASSSDGSEDIIERIFDAYEINCTNLHNIEAQKLDRLIEAYRADKELSKLNEIVALVRSAHSKSLSDQNDLIGSVCSYITEHSEANLTQEALAEQFHFSVHYLRHVFKKHTGMSIGEFKMTQRIKKAKLLLKTDDHKIIDIAAACGFENASYFTEAFVKATGISPSAYRKAAREVQ